MNLMEIIRPTTSWLFDGKAGHVYIEGRKSKGVKINSAPPDKKKYYYETADHLHPTRKCSICGVEKVADEFSLSKIHKNGRRPECKACRNARERKRGMERRMSAV